MLSALMFCEKMVKELESKGLLINHHEPYVANLTLNGIQMEITWNVENPQNTMLMQMMRQKVYNEQSKYI